MQPPSPRISAPRWQQLLAGAAANHPPPCKPAIGGPNRLRCVLHRVAIVQVGSPLQRRRVEQRHLHRQRELRPAPHNIPLSLALAPASLPASLHLLQLRLPQAFSRCRLARSGYHRASRAFSSPRRTASPQPSWNLPLAQSVPSSWPPQSLISTFGCVNGMLLAGRASTYAMGRDGLFFQSVRKTQPSRPATPRAASRSLPLGAVGVDLPALPLGSYGQLLDYVIFAVLVFYILTIAGLFVLRRTQPDAPRPYRALATNPSRALYPDGCMDLCCTLAI